MTETASAISAGLCALQRPGPRWQAVRDFAKQDYVKHDDVAAAGNGFVDEFELNGKMLQRVASNGLLDSPWGLAIAPQSFGPFAGDLLIGNFGDGTIDAVNLKKPGPMITIRRKP
jgi:uncharacterized protein (TIGR03118 family)